MIKNKKLQIETTNSKSPKKLREKTLKLTIKIEKFVINIISNTITIKNKYKKVINIITIRIPA